MVQLDPMGAGVPKEGSPSRYKDPVHCQKHVTAGREQGLAMAILLLHGSEELREPRGGSAGSEFWK